MIKDIKDYTVQELAELKASSEIEYNKAYDIAKAYVDKHNFCNIHKDEDGTLLCNGVFSGQEGLCCKGCSHLGVNGCTTKSVGCTVGYCYFGDSPIDSDLVEYSEELEEEYEEMRAESRACFSNSKLFHGQLLRMNFEQTWKYLRIPITKENTYSL